MIGFLLSIVGLVALVILAFIGGIVIGVGASIKDFKEKIEPASEEDKRVIRKYLKI